MLYRLSFLIASLFALHAAAGLPDSLLRKKMSYPDYLFLHNVQRGSDNPTAISQEALNSVGSIAARYRFMDGDFHAPDAAGIQKSFDASFYGIKKLEKVAFEGILSYSNTSDRDRHWNSTLFVSPDNPFVIGDSIPGNFGIEKFHLNGGFSIKATRNLHVALRANFIVGSSANQTDPRPEVDGMRFALNPGISYQLGRWTAGLSGNIEWLSESAEYTVVRSTDGTHYVFLFHGLSAPIAKNAIGYQRKYSGTAGKGALQLTWKGNDLQNHFEASYMQGKEEAEDGGSAEKYKGGKYEAKSVAVADRFMIIRSKKTHNIGMQLNYRQVDGTSYQQQQQTTPDGNIYWNVISSAICHKSDFTDIAISYRFDALTNEGIPHFTAGAEMGFYRQQTTHYSELYRQEFTSAFAKVFTAKNLHVKKFDLKIGVDAAYATRLSDENKIESSKITERLFTPKFEFLSADRLSASIRVSLFHPLSIKTFHAAIGGFASYRYDCYIGNFKSFDATARHSVEAGLQLVF